MLKSLIKRVRASLGLVCFDARGRYLQDGLFTIHSDGFRSDRGFRAAYERGVRASRGIDPGYEWRVHIALWAAHAALRAEGDFVECGVNAGFISSAIMERLRWHTVGRRFHLIDTFAGPVLAQYSPEELRAGRAELARQALESGAYVTDIDRVRANFAEWENAIITRGPIPEALNEIDANAVAFLHIDLNCAKPERAALEFFWERLSPGAVVLLDDYGYYGHHCQREAIDAAARERGAEILFLPTGQGMIIK